MTTTPAPDSRTPNPGAMGAPLDAVAGGTELVLPTPTPGRRPITLKHYLWVAAALVVVYFALTRLGAVLTPFLVGAILAYLGTPLVDALERRGVHRGIGTTITVLLFGVALLGLFLVLVPLVQAEVALVMKRVPELFAQASERLLPWLDRVFGITVALDFATLRELLADNVESVRDVGLRVLAGVRTGGLLLVSILVNLALIPVVMFYLLRDWNRIVERIDDLLPRRWEVKVRQIAREIDDVLAEFLRGQLLVMLVLAAFYALALWAVGLNHAFAIGVLTGLLVFIPYVGFGLGLVLGMVAALLQWSGLPFFLSVLAVYGAGQLLENYVLIPYLVGDRIGLHPVAVIFALLAFGQVFGFAGVLLALPVSAALLVALRHVRAAYADSPLYRDE
ncbi:MAG TPA: AI-2E family transporter [Candidatus Saccharimonadia bacterium]|nr:AI-2E family transporter [Candidatus Saccharimonadia bacterium]